MIVSLARQIACIQRELNMRHRVYQRRVSANQMTQHMADEEIAAMEAVMETLKRVQAENEPSLFGEDGQ